MSEPDFVFDQAKLLRMRPAFRRVLLANARIAADLNDPAADREAARARIEPFIERVTEEET